MNQRINIMNAHQVSWYLTVQTVREYFWKRKRNWIQPGQLCEDIRNKIERYKDIKKSLHSWRSCWYTLRQSNVTMLWQAIKSLVTSYHESIDFMSPSFLLPDTKWWLMVIGIFGVKRNWYFFVNCKSNSSTVIYHSVLVRQE